MAWSPHREQEFAVACADGCVKIYNIASMQPVLKLDGHEKRAFNVTYNPQIPYILASGSDD